MIFFTCVYISKQKKGAGKQDVAQNVSKNLQACVN